MTIFYLKNYQIRLIEDPNIKLISFIIKIIEICNFKNKNESYYINNIINLVFFNHHDLFFLIFIIVLIFSLIVLNYLLNFFSNFYYIIHLISAHNVSLFLFQLDY